MYAGAFSTGAISGTTNALAGFSSRGPSLDGSFRRSPTFGAGRDVRSSLRHHDTRYGNLSGTSMARPHVVGGSPCSGRRGRASSGTSRGRSGS